MTDNRSPKVRFFDDLTDIHCAARVAQALINWQLDRCRAIEFDQEGDSYTLVFQSSGLEDCLFAVRDLVERANSLCVRADKLFPDEDDLDDASGN